MIGGCRVFSTNLGLYEVGEIWDHNLRRQVHCNFVLLLFSFAIFEVITKRKIHAIFIKFH